MFEIAQFNEFAYLFVEFVNLLLDTFEFSNTDDFGLCGREEGDLLFGNDGFAMGLVFFGHEHFGKIGCHEFARPFAFAFGGHTGGYSTT